LLWLMGLHSSHRNDPSDLSTLFFKVKNKYYFLL
jgi:hypothetical protein